MASLSDCLASVRSASAVSMLAWSLAICSGVSVLAAAPVPPVLPPGLVPDPVEPVLVLVMSALNVASVADAAVWFPELVGGVPVPELPVGVEPLPPDGPVPEDSAHPVPGPSAVSSFETAFWSLDTCLLVRRDGLQRRFAGGLAWRGARVGARAVALGLRQVGRLLLLVGVERGLVLSQRCWSVTVALEVPELEPPDPDAPEPPDPTCPSPRW